jgi:hypothetical protein
MEQAASLVANLVTQFSSAFDCFRELVQNSIDAGSPRIEVWTEYESSEDHLGTGRITVEDIGEGMDEAIIDTQFTRLFASSKDGDLTKIGKFGIGFVSVFALEPKVVLVHTGRSGEYWEVLFHEDRTFTKTLVDEPIEGTVVTLFLEADYHRYQEIAAQVEESLRAWCAHATAEITFENRTPRAGVRATIETINRPFGELDALCVVSQSATGTRIVCGYSVDPKYSFFNSGLTLASTHAGEDVLRIDQAERLRRVSVKVDSRYLEHTLSRDTVMRNGEWEQVCQDIVTVADTLLPARLLDELENVVAERNWSLATMHRYSQLIGFLANEEDHVIKHVVDRRVLRDVHGDALTPVEVWKTYRTDGRVLVSEGPTELTRRLKVLGIPVLLAKWARPHEATAVWSDHPLDSVPLMIARCVALRSRSTFWGTVKRFFGANLTREVESAIADPRLVYLPVSVDEEPPDSAGRLIDRASTLLDAIGAGYKVLGTFVPSSPSPQIPFFVTGRGFDEVMARPPRGFENRSHAAVNREHPHFRRLVTLFDRRPDLAAYCLAKSLLLTDDRLLHRDLDLISAARGHS